MTILHFKVLAAIFRPIKINSNNRKIRPYSQFYSLITPKCVPLILMSKTPRTECIGLIIESWVPKFI